MVGLTVGCEVVGVKVGAGVKVGVKVGFAVGPAVALQHVTGQFSAISASVVGSVHQPRFRKS